MQVKEFDPNIELIVGVIVLVGGVSELEKNGGVRNEDSASNRKERVTDALFLRSWDAFRNFSWNLNDSCRV